jgi:hypothetical protein
VNPSGWLLLAAVAAAASCYAVSCWWWPWAACRRCKGNGRLSRRDGKVWRPCRRCGTTGRRLRAGRRLYHYISGEEGPSWS